jgi:hypothetical protein
MRFENRTDSVYLDNFIQDATMLLLPHSKMTKELWHKNDWRYNSGTFGTVVLNKLLLDSAPVSVHIVPKKRKTSAVAYTQNGEIFLYDDYIVNGLRENIVGTLLHEYAHCQGFNHFSFFGTSNYKTKAKCLYSVPYFLSENVSRWL